MSLTVIKLGGSLLNGDYLSPWLDEIKQFSLKENIIIVPGGGIFADTVRAQQPQLGFNDQTAHRLALLAMTQTAQLFRELCPDLTVLNHSGKLLPLLDKGLPLLWLPLELLNDQTDIPASWDYTSDSIALWLSQVVRAERLVLVKSKPPEAGLKQLIKQGYIDKGFQYLMKNIECNIYIFSALESARLQQPKNWSNHQIKS